MASIEVFGYIKPFKIHDVELLRFFHRCSTVRPQLSPKNQNKIVDKL
jgi:hypothetical protein